jgi:hypothetical protein
MPYEDPEEKKEKWDRHLEDAKFVAPYVAKSHRALFDACVKEGFSREEALEILVAEITRDGEEAEDGEGFLGN